MICFSCGRGLSMAEAFHYGNRCESCEREWFERIEAWRHGAEDVELDAMFDEARILH